MTVIGPGKPQAEPSLFTRWTQPILQSKIVTKVTQYTRLFSTAVSCINFKTNLSRLKGVFNYNLAYSSSSPDWTVWR